MEQVDSLKWIMKPSHSKALTKNMYTIYFTIIFESFWFLRINSICCAGVGVQTNNGQPGAGHCKLSKLSKWLQILDKPKLFIVLAAAADDKQGNIFLHDSRCRSDGRNAGPMLATNWGTGSHHGPSVTATVSVAWHWIEFSNFDINVYRQYAQNTSKN